MRVTIGLMALTMAAPAMAEGVPSSARTMTQDVAGLTAPAEILIDHWGIPHIYAASERDAFFLQGYNAARDRLWQIDLWRKRGLGLLARDFGVAYVDQDRAARLFLYRGDMNREWAAYGAPAKGRTEAFVAGINAFVDEIASGKRPLPTEFRIAGTRPDRWQAEDVVRIRSHGLTRNVPSEVRRSQVACAAGLEADGLRSRMEPAWRTKVPAGFDPCSIPADVLKDYALATAGVRFDKATKVAAFDADAFLDDAADRVETIGSNHWTVAGSRTDTGRPILASDPHRGHSAPSLRYVVQMTAPGLSVIGAGEPALPGISIGHNGTIAFGLTIFNVDQEDLYVYQLDDKAAAYRYRGSYEPIRTITETIEVKGGAPRTVELSFTRHGPVLKVDPATRRAWAVRTVWLEPGTSAYFGSSDYMTRRDWTGFLDSMDRWATPSENQIYADTSGNIGWVAAGMIPRRKGYDGLLPVPGDGRYDWDGFYRRDELPSSYNPAAGWLATANQMNLPADWPLAKKPVGFEWADPSRYERIAEVLAADNRMTLARSMALQNDDVSPLQRRLVALARQMPVDGLSPLEAKALELVRGWDATVGRDSSAASVAELWLNRHLIPAIAAATLPEAARPLVNPGSPGAALDMMDRGPANRNTILTASLKATVAQLSGLLGSDPDRWQWGRLHQAKFVHALTPLADPRERGQLAVGPLELGGSATTPHAASYGANFDLTAGASFRMVLDVGNWDASRVINAPGQAGDPFSPHYRDLAPLWADGRYVPMLYSREAVEAATAERLVLNPAGGGR